MSEFHTEAPQAIANEGLVEGPYMAARPGFEPATLQTKGDESTNEPPHPTVIVLVAKGFTCKLCLQAKLITYAHWSLFTLPTIPSWPRTNFWADTCTRPAQGI